MGTADGPLVGRETELKRIDAALDAIESGGPACIAIAGEPGIGKSRLMTELGRRAETRGHVVLDGMAAEFERDLAYSVVIEALDAYLASFEQSLLDEWGPELLGRLAGIFPSITRSGTGATSGPVLDRHASHRAVLGLLERLATPRPLVITLDDVHWADSASVALIGALLRRGPEAGVLLVLAYRPGQADQGLTTALSSPAVRHLKLDRLNKEESRELLGPGVSAGAAAEIYFETAGNPFCLEQLARATSRTTTNSGANANALELGIVPAPVAVAIADEINMLPPGARTLLNCAAVAGEPFELDLAGDIAGLDMTDALAALDELLGLGIVHGTDVPRRFVFRHPLVRRSVYESIPGGERLAAHARASEALEARGASAAERALHVEQSAVPGDEAAIALLIEAGESTLARIPDAAAHRFEAAVRLLPAGDDSRWRVLTSLASALSSSGELERSRSVLLEALELLPADAQGPRAELTAACAKVEHWLGRREDAHVRLTRIYQSLADARSRESALLEIELAADGIHANDVDQAIPLGARALETALELDDIPMAALAASVLALAETSAGRAEEARTHRDQAMELIAGLSDSQLVPVLDVFFYLAWAGNYLEHFDQAIGHADRGLEISRRSGEGRMLVPLTLAKAHPLEMKGQLALACQICEDASEIARLSGNPRYLHWALWELAWALLLTGDIEGAIRHGEESANSWELLGAVMPARSGEPGWTLGRALMEAGEVERGLAAMLEGVGDENLENVVPPERSLALLELALADLALGRIDSAGELAEQSLEVAEEVGLAVPLAYAERARAAVMLARLEPAEAAALAQRSADLAAGAGARFEAARSMLLGGQALVAAGEREQAVALLRLAEAELDECGAMRGRDEARRELRALGARAEPRGKGGQADSGLDSLTSREREIADLVTDRKTNRQIAEQLFLSEKTIETHLRNVFGKLGAANRVEVARAVERARRS